jgi:RNase P/RNase MRP subunit p29
VNVIGEKITVLTSPDPTKTGITGRVMMETLNTLLVESSGRTLQVEKAGAAFMLLNTGIVLTGLDLAGRLPDRLGRRAP